MTAPTQGETYWRSLDELERSPQFEEFLRREFPVGASEFPRGVSRRRWLQLMGASLALAGLNGCRRWDTEEFAPFAVRSENRTPGEAQRFATTIELAGAPRHLLVTSYDGRPIKIEGNPDHPASRGATDLYAQAAILDLYDPDRSGSVRRREKGKALTQQWSDFEAFCREHFSGLAESQGAGLALIVEPSSSVMLEAAIQRWRERFPQAGVCRYSPLMPVNEVAGAQQAFGRPLRTQLHLERARTIVVFDGDLLHGHPDALRHARDLAASRDPESGSMSRLYAAESQFSLTGSAADHRLAIASHRIAALVGQLEANVFRLLEGEELTAPSDESREARWIRVVARELVENRGAGVVVAGERQSPEVHAHLHRLNVRLGNVGSTVTYLAATPAEGTLSFAELVDAMNGGLITTLVMLGGNPLYDAPVDLEFGKALERVAHTIHLAAYEDETSEACEWHLPAAHPLEHWDVHRAYDGLLSVSQPLIAPLREGRSAAELLDLLTGHTPADPAAAARQAAEHVAGALSDQQWRRAVHDGFVPGTEYETVAAEPSADELPGLPSEASADQLELVFTAADTLYDGRFANNSWLQETPGLLTKLTWDNAAIIHPATARELGVRQSEMVAIQFDGRTLHAPVMLLPGQARNSIGLALGYGRTAAGHVGGLKRADVDSVGANAYRLRTVAARHVATGVTIRPTGKTYELATTQDHHAIDTLGLAEIGKRVGALVREATLDEYREHPDVIHHHAHHPPLESLWEEPSYEGHAWGMAIDLNKCIGCNACMVACQSENNVPVVGKEQVLRGREMHWIRVDRYFTGDPDEPAVVAQPVTCQQCENAPCEQVCPVAATVHSSEGLNDMVYNRCIGTRYCANNCPYKVRRFNFFDFNKHLTEPGRELVQLVINPEVSVRARGVMEKCTYCVQRIQAGKIDAKTGRRPLGDGDILTACQQACPTRAIEFGDLNQSESRVAVAHRNPRAYAMLAELNVKPRTKYLARIRNPHPELSDEPAGGHDHDEHGKDEHEHHG